MNFIDKQGLKTFLDQLKNKFGQKTILDQCNAERNDCLLNIDYEKDLAFKTDEIVANAITE